MSYDTDGVGGLGAHGRLQYGSGRQDVEEEPSELDAPESDGLDDDLDDGMEAMSPLAEDQVKLGEDEEPEGFASAKSSADDDQDDDIDADPAVHLSGGAEGPNMSEADRRREFPTAGEAKRALAGKRGDEPRATKRRGRKKIARA